MLHTNSIVEVVRRITELLLCPLCVSSGCIEILVPEDLGQRHQVILIVSKELVGHRVTKQVWINLEAANGAVLVTQVPNATISQRTTLTDEHLF